MTGRRRWARRAGVGSVVLILAVWASNCWIAERFVATALLCYAPQYVLGMAPLVAACMAVLARDRVAAVLCAAAFLIPAVGPMGLAIHWPRAARAPAVRVATYNIKAGGLGVDRVAATIRGLDADVVCLQETFDQRRREYVTSDLRRRLPGYRLVEGGSLAIASRLPVLTTRTETLMPGVPYRPLLAITTAVGARRFTIANVHFLLETPGHLRHGAQPRVPLWVLEAGAIREKQVGRLLDLLRTDSRSTVVCGDLNTPPLGLAFRRLRRVFTDSFGASGLGFGYTYPARTPVLRIDHVLVGSGLWPTWARVGGGFASDHLPLVVGVTARD